MSRKRFSPEQIVAKLREADVLLSQGKKVVEGAGSQRGYLPPLAPASPMTQAEHDVWGSKKALG